MLSGRQSVTLCLLFPTAYVALLIASNWLVATSPAANPVARFVLWTVVLFGPLCVLFRLHRSRRFPRLAIFAGILAATGSLYLSEPAMYRHGWVLRAKAYAQDIFDVPPHSVRCQFVERTRIALACEVDLNAGVLEQLAPLTAGGAASGAPCGDSKSDPCAKVMGYCKQSGTLNPGVEVYDASFGATRAAIETHKSELSYNLMLENFYIDRPHNRACLVINTGGSDRMRC